MRAIQVTFDETLLERLDSHPAVRERGRSAVLREAARHFLRHLETEEVDRRYAMGYGDSESIPGRIEWMGPGRGMAGKLAGSPPRRGEIWEYRLRKPDKRRPVVVLTRQRVLPLLNTAMVAPITSTVRGLPSEVPVGTEEGLDQRSVVNLDHVQTVDQRRLHAYVGALSEGKMRQVCRALALATGCG